MSPRERLEQAARVIVGGVVFAVLTFAWFAWGGAYIGCGLLGVCA